jgi:hypothetical protein
MHLIFSWVTASVELWRRVGDTVLNGCVRLSAPRSAPRVSLHSATLSEPARRAHEARPGRHLHLVYIWFPPDSHVTSTWFPSDLHQASGPASESPPSRAQPAPLSPGARERSRIRSSPAAPGIAGGTPSQTQASPTTPVIADAMPSRMQSPRVVTEAAIGGLLRVSAAWSSRSPTPWSTPRRVDHGVAP